MCDSRGGDDHRAVLLPAETGTDIRGRRSDALRVVVADDHDAYRRGLARAIDRHHGLELAGEAADGESALDLVLRLVPDVALLDVRMPGLDGLELARRLGALEGTTIVLLTGSHTTVLCGAARQAGARALLSKELSRYDICRRILALG
jgi:two-component system nitrate/nitrite response regulator NarL